MRGREFMLQRPRRAPAYPLPGRGQFSRRDVYRTLLWGPVGFPRGMPTVPVVERAVSFPTNLIPPP